MFLNFVRRGRRRPLGRRPRLGARHRLPDRRGAVATPAEPPSGPGPHRARLGHPGWSKYIYVPMGVRVAIPTSRAAAPSPAASAASGSSGATTACGPPGGRRDRGRWCATTRSASSSWPTRSPPSTATSSSPSARNSSSASCRAVGHQHPRHRHPCVTKLLPLFRKAGLIREPGHRAAAQLKLDRFNKGDHDRAEQRAIQLLRDAGIVTGRSSSWVWRTRPPRRWKKPTGWRATGTRTANWAMYTPWPSRPVPGARATRSGSSISKYNFVTPIMKPDALERGNCSTRVMNNYRRFFA